MPVTPERARHGAEQIAARWGPFLLAMPRLNKTLPILDNLDDIRIASPCHADWEGMKALTDEDGARARFCGSCEKNVYDLSSMTRTDALALIERHEGKCCVRFYKRADGTVLTDDCPVGFKAALKKAQMRTLAGIASCAGAVAAAVSFLLGTANPISQKLGTFEQTYQPVAGGIQPIEMKGDVGPSEPPVVEMGKPPPVVMGEPMPPPPPPPKKLKPKKPTPQPKMGGLRVQPKPPETPPEAWMGDVLVE